MGYSVSLTLSKSDVSLTTHCLVFYWTLASIWLATHWLVCYWHCIVFHGYWLVFPADFGSANKRTDHFLMPIRTHAIIDVDFWGNENYLWVICSKFRWFALFGLLRRHCGVFELFELLQSPSFIWKRVLFKGYTVTLHFYITISHLFFVSCTYMHAWMHECMNAWMHECMNAWMHECMHIRDDKFMYEVHMNGRCGGRGQRPEDKKKSVSCWKLQSSLELGMSVYRSINGTRFLYYVS